MKSPFDNITIGPITLRNRFIKSGANEGMSRNGIPTKAMLKHHGDLARGGIGLTTVAYGAVNEVGRTLPNQIVMRESSVKDLKALTDEIHSHGAAASIQITHGGPLIMGLRVKGSTMSSSSGINKAGLLSGNFWQRAMKESDMQAVIDAFVGAAHIAQKANFDAVEIHMGHGYLLNQFISPLSNKRRDQYGGNAENRARFPARVLKAVKEAVGKDLAVLAKINVADGIPKGATATDGAITAQILEQAGADMLVLSGGRNIESTWFMFGSIVSQEGIARVLKNPISRLIVKATSLSKPKKIRFKEMYFHKYSMQIRKAVSLPLAYLGGVKSLANAEKAIADGFECVVMARALVHDEALVNKFKSGEITRSSCDNCNKCVNYIHHPGGTWCIKRPANDPTINEIPASQ